MIGTLFAKFAAAGPAAKAGLAAGVLSLATVGGAAAGVLPAAAEEAISEVVEDVTGIELPSDDAAADDGATDPGATEDTTFGDDTTADGEEASDEDATTDDDADGTEDGASENDDATDEESEDPDSADDADSSAHRNFGSWVSGWAHSADKPDEFGRMVSAEAHRRNEARRAARDTDAPEADAAPAPAPEPDSAAAPATEPEKPERRPAAAKSGKSSDHKPADPGRHSGKGRPAGAGGRK